MRSIGMVLLALWAIGWGAMAAAAESRVALVIGNGAYRNTTPLVNPLNDARDMSAALKAAGFDVVEAFDADKRALDGALRSFTDKLTTADVALFYYAGHGLQVGAQNYLVPIDARLERERDLEFEAVRLDFVLRQMEIDRDGKTNIVLLDACRDNPLSKNLARTMGTRSAAIGRGLAAASTGLGTFIAYATQPGNVALDGEGRNSPFTQAMVKHMGTTGRNLPATMIEVRKDVVAATGGRQVPWDHSALTGEFYFVPGAGAASPIVTGATGGGGADVTALQERLKRLEDDAKRREAAGPVITADGLRLAELRARAAGVDDLAKDLQRKLMAARMQEGRAADAAEKARLQRESMNIQMEWTRRGQDLRRLKDEIAALEAGPVATPPGVAATPPITPKAVVGKQSPNFDMVDNVGLLGVEIGPAFHTPSPTACREACEKDATCAGFQHGRRAPMMGMCELFSRVDDRREDLTWRSGLRTRSTSKSE